MVKVKTYLFYAIFKILLYHRRRKTTTSFPLLSLLQAKNSFIKISVAGQGVFAGLVVVIEEKVRNLLV